MNSFSVLNRAFHLPCTFPHVLQINISKHSVFIPPFLDSSSTPTVSRLMGKVSSLTTWPSIVRIPPVFPSHLLSFLPGSFPTHLISIPSLMELPVFLACHDCPYFVTLAFAYPSVGKAFSILQHSPETFAFSHSPHFLSKSYFFYGYRWQVIFFMIDSLKTFPCNWKTWVLFYLMKFIARCIDMIWLFICCCWLSLFPELKRNPDTGLKR